LSSALKGLRDVIASAAIRNRLFLFLWSFVAAVSFYDGYLLVENREVIKDTEENPVCRYLLEINRGDVSLLLRSKALGTGAALLVMVAVWWRDQRVGLPITASVAVFQLALLLYLTFAPPGLLDGSHWKEPAMAWVRGVDKTRAVH
jgi:hypothetical protein